jgi:hypothetical protein
LSLYKVTNFYYKWNSILNSIMVDFEGELCPDYFQGQEEEQVVRSDS